MSSGDSFSHIDRIVKAHHADRKAAGAAPGTVFFRLCAHHMLGIKPGEAVVMRNIGGQITPDLLERLGLLGRMGQVAGEIPGGGGEFHLIVLQHTDCGIARLAGDPALLTHYFQIQERELRAKSVGDPRVAVAVDVAVLRAIPALPDDWLLSGLIYEVATGLAEIVVPPAPIRTARDAAATPLLCGAHSSLG
jgi:carbonic anhydrase